MLDREFFIMLIISFPLYFVGKWIYKIKETKREIREYPNRVYINNIVKSIDDMDGRGFELFVGKVFECLDYKVYLTPATRDMGKDLVIKDIKGKTYVEIKRYASSNLIGRPLVQKLVGATMADGVNKAIFITTSDFTSDAILYANNAKNIEIKLVNLNEFLDMCLLCNKQEIMEYLECEYDYEIKDRYSNVVSMTGKRLGN